MPQITHCRRCRIVRLLALGGWTAGILWLSLTPSPPDLSGSLFGWDKVQHASAYGLLAFLAGRAFELYLVPATRAWLLAALVALVYGGLLEIAQGALTQVRMADVQDLFANATGAFAVYAWAWFRFREGRE